MISIIMIYNNDWNHRYTEHPSFSWVWAGSPHKSREKLMNSLINLIDEIAYCIINSSLRRINLLYILKESGKR